MHRHHWIFGKRQTHLSNHPNLELGPLSPPFIHEPWLLTSMEQELITFKLGEHYPIPIVDVELAQKEARVRLWGLKKNRSVKKESERLLNRHTLKNKKP